MINMSTFWNAVSLIFLIDVVISQDCGGVTCAGIGVIGVAGVIFILVILGIIIAVPFGLCAMCGYYAGCLKATEAPPRPRVQHSDQVPTITTSDGNRTTSPPPSYTEVQRNYMTYGSVYKTESSRRETPPPSYSSIGV